MCSEGSEVAINTYILETRLGKAYSDNNKHPQQPLPLNYMQTVAMPTVAMQTFALQTVAMQTAAIYTASRQTVAI